MKLGRGSRSTAKASSTSATFADPGARDVAVEERGEAQGEARDPDHDHRPGAAGRPARGRRRRGGAAHAVAGPAARSAGSAPGRAGRRRPRGGSARAAPARPRRARCWRPTSTATGCIIPVSPGLLAEPDEDVVDEDHPDRQRERRRARLLLAAERERRARAGRTRGRRPGSRTSCATRPRSGPTPCAACPARAARRSAAASSRQRHLAVALGEQQLLAVGEELVDRQVPAHRAEGGPVVLARVARRRSCAGCPARARCARSGARGRPPARRCWARISFGSRDVAGVVDQQVLPAGRCRARCPGRRASSGPGSRLVGEGARPSRRCGPCSRPARTRSRGGPGSRREARPR